MSRLLKKWYGSNSMRREETIEYQCDTHWERTFQDGEEEFIYGRDEDKEEEPHHKPVHI